MEAEAKLSVTALTVIEERGDKFVRRMCMHCEDPACASACLVGALKKTASGPVTYDGSKCIGCRYCLVACPFNVPRYEWSKLVPYVKKCDMCAERQLAGKLPACVEACPTGASISGTRQEMLEEAERRLLSDSNYVKHIYGSEEAGGTSVFFISDVLFENLGFGAPPKQPMPMLTANALGDGPTVIMMGGALLSGLYWITQRRAEVAAAENRQRENTTEKNHD